MRERAVLLHQRLEGFSLPLDETAWEKLERFHAFLMEKNAVMDLTNVPEEDMPLRHYADSLLALNHGLFSRGCRVIDVGTGAGFPGIPLAIARPDMQMTLLESMQKRCDFLSKAVSLLDLRNVRVMAGRAEDMGRGDFREQFDLALARAVAVLPVLAEYLLPLVKVGGHALCWKGPALWEELPAGERACQRLGGELGALIDLEIPGRSHYIQVINKVNATPAKYPRKAGMPGKKPLG
jgi:16S rRNA (guanine527-N7)-methyltransferase